MDQLAAINLDVFYRSDLLPWSYKCDEYNRCVKDKVVKVGEGRRHGEETQGALCSSVKSEFFFLNLTQNMLM